MKQLLITIAAVLVVGCGGPPKDIREAARQGNIEAVKQYLADGVDVNAKDDWGKTPLHYATANDQKETVELLIAEGAEVNVMSNKGQTPLDWAINSKVTEIVELLRKHGAKTGEIQSLR